MTYTVGDLRRDLQAYDDDYELEIDGGLTVYRVKTRGDKLAVLEFNEFQAMLSPEFKNKFPEVKVAFCSVESDGSVVQEVGIPEL
ncbi:MAG: hypothetical protein AAGG09_00100 [Pseudomonadota bacterium]